MATEESIIRIPPYHYIHVLDQNSNVSRVEVGPKTYIRQDNERWVLGLGRGVPVRLAGSIVHLLPAPGGAGPGVGDGELSLLFTVPLRSGNSGPLGPHTASHLPTGSCLPPRAW